MQNRYHDNTRQYLPLRLKHDYSATPHIHGRSGFTGGQVFNRQRAERHCKFSNPYAYSLWEVWIHSVAHCARNMVKTRGGRDYIIISLRKLQKKSVMDSPDTVTMVNERFFCEACGMEIFKVSLIFEKDLRFTCFPEVSRSIALPHIPGGIHSSSSLSSNTLYSLNQPINMTCNAAPWLHCAWQSCMTNKVFFLLKRYKDNAALHHDVIWMKIMCFDIIFLMALGGWAG